MALTKDVNSYVTVAEADLFFADKLDVAAWTTADESQKAQSLITATNYLDELTWVGVAVSELQPLAFPRSGSYFDPRLGMRVSLSGVPQRILKATCELAYHLLNNDGLLDDTGQVRTISLGSITLTDIKPASKIPSHVKRSIAAMLLQGESNIWWRAN